MAEFFSGYSGPVDSIVRRRYEEVFRGHKVTEFVPYSKMIWSGGMPLGLFKGERTFSLAQVAPDAVEFSMTEIYSGLLSPLVEGSLPDMQPAFEEFALRLKECAEKGE